MPHDVHNKRQRFKPPTIEEKRRYLDGCNLLHQRAWQKKLPGLYNQLCYAGEVAYEPAVLILTTLIAQHRLNDAGSDFKRRRGYPDSFTEALQYKTTRYKLVKSVKAVTGRDISPRQAGRGLQVLANKELLHRTQGPAGKRKWMIYIQLHIGRIMHLCDHPEEAGKRQKMAICNVKEKGGRMTSSGQHSYIRRVEGGCFGSFQPSVGPVPFTPPSGSSDIRRECPSGTLINYSGLRPEPRPGSTPFVPVDPLSPEAKAVLDYVSARDVLTNQNGAHVPLHLTPEQKCLLTGLVRNHGLTVAWLKLYEGAIHGYDDRGVGLDAQETWWLKVTPEVFAARFYAIKRELEKARISARLDMRKDLESARDSVRYRSMLMQTVELMAENTGLLLSGCDNTNPGLDAALAVITVKFLPTIEERVPGITQKVMDKWFNPARFFLMTNTITLAELAKDFPMQEWFQLWDSLMVKAGKDAEADALAWMAEGDSLQRRLMCLDSN